MSRVSQYKPVWRIVGGRSRGGGLGGGVRLGGMSFRWSCCRERVGWVWTCGKSEEGRRREGGRGGGKIGKGGYARKTGQYIRDFE